ncbi:SRPBCC family protein [Saccharothrix australiensis]|uniref:Polyketide cyclase/dehydrase/lipid transport protein n=1 Tax=Saccharothrix australiensis TaxID=2072 RepID=A0A495VYS3_9PSEU|nr:SRPBCC family protein [Saccharothrix australiensis]RKT53980.1 polyketide cyclase/dehydrase/lipid transport protein [Saccharothrix australiensis]
MVEVSLRVSAPLEQVFGVLADGWSYASWVVGAAHIREVDADWPAPGARIHHSIGPWPLQVKDITTVRAVVAGRMLELDARMWPLGAAHIRFDLIEAGGATTVRMREEVEKGPLSLLPAPVQALALTPRNRESLRRFADLAERRQATR